MINRFINPTIVTSINPTINHSSSTLRSRDHFTTFVIAEVRERAH